MKWDNKTTNEILTDLKLLRLAYEEQKKKISNEIDVLDKMSDEFTKGQEELKKRI